MTHHPINPEHQARLLNELVDQHAVTPHQASAMSGREVDRRTEEMEGRSKLKQDFLVEHKLATREEFAGASDTDIEKIFAERFDPEYYVRGDKLQVESKDIFQKAEDSVIRSINCFNTSVKQKFPIIRARHGKDYEDHGRDHIDLVLTFIYEDEEEYDVPTQITFSKKAEVHRNKERALRKGREDAARTMILIVDSLDDVLTADRHQNKNPREVANVVSPLLTQIFTQARHNPQYRDFAERLFSRR